MWQAQDGTPGGDNQKKTVAIIWAPKLVTSQARWKVQVQENNTEDNDFVVEMRLNK